MTQRIVGALLASLIMFLALFAPHAAVAAVDLDALIVTPAGYGVAEPGEEDVYSGPVTDEGQPRPEGWAPAPDSPVVAGWMKTFQRTDETAYRQVQVTAYEMKSTDLAARLVASASGDTGGGLTFDAGIPGAAAAKLEESVDGAPVGQYNVVAAQGVLVFRFVAESYNTPLAPFQEELITLAKAQLAAASSAGGAGSTGTAPSEDDKFEISRNIGRLAGMVTAPVLGVALGALLVKKIRKPKTTTWTNASAYYPSTGIVAAPTPDGGYAPPASSGGAPPPPGGYAPAPSGPIPGPVFAAEYEPPPATAPGGVAIRTVQAQDCPSCRKDFGKGTECESCGALRTLCAVCGTKIWAGALTCPEHSGRVR